jgi:hypothetical protein
MNTKAWYMSKSLWTGVIVVILGGLQALQSLPMNESTAGIVSVVLGVLVVLNRLVTTMPITDSSVSNLE